MPRRLHIVLTAGHEIDGSCAACHGAGKVIPWDNHAKTMTINLCDLCSQELSRSRRGFIRHESGSEKGSGVGEQTPG